MSLALNTVLCEAIKSRRLLEITYRGGLRLVEPYSHGFSRERREVLVAFQRTGESDSGHVQGWKAFHVDEMGEVVILDVPFMVNQAGYRGGGYSKNLGEVHCCV